MSLAPVSTRPIIPAGDLAVGVDAAVRSVAPATPTFLEVRRTGLAGRVLLLGVVLAVVSMALVALDPLRATFWELAHWDISAATAVVAIGLSLPGTSGLVRQIGIGSLAAMITWLLSNTAWTVLVLTGTTTLPSIVDLLALLWVVPGAWMLIVSARGRMSRAEEAAIYLDDALVLVATVAVLLAIFGPTAMFIGGVPGLLVTVYPAVFLGAAAMSVIGVVATRQPLRLEGGIAFAVGTGLIGVGYAWWVIPTVTGGPVDHLVATLFSAGPLVVAYGAITWRGPVALEARTERAAGLVGWAIGPLALLVTAISTALVLDSEAVEHILYPLTVVATFLLTIRFGFHLRERGVNLAHVQRLHAENELLIERLRLEATERERDHARLVDASRMSAVGELAAAVAHEVNNPLTGVLGYTDLLLTDPGLKPGVREDLEIVRAEALRVRDRVRVLLEFATPRRSETVRSDLGAIVAAPLTLLRYNLERRGLTVEERYAAMAPILLDPAAIQQVVINVVTEVAAAMVEGGRLVITTEATSDGASVFFDATASNIDLAALDAAGSPFDRDDSDALPGGAIAASHGVLRGHGGTIGMRIARPDHVRLEIHLPSGASTGA